MCLQLQICNFSDQKPNSFLVFFLRFFHSSIGYNVSWSAMSAVFAATVHSLCATDKQILRKKNKPSQLSWLHNVALACQPHFPLNTTPSVGRFALYTAWNHSETRMDHPHGPLSHDKTGTLHDCWLFRRDTKPFAQMPWMTQSVLGLECFLLRKQVSKQFACNLKHEHLDNPSELPNWKKNMQYSWTRQKSWKPIQKKKVIVGTNLWFEKEAACPHKTSIIALERLSQKLHWCQDQDSFKWFSLIPNNPLHSSFWQPSRLQWFLPWLCGT